MEDHTVGHSSMAVHRDYDGRVSGFEDIGNNGAGPPASVRAGYEGLAS